MVAGAGVMNAAGMLLQQPLCGLSEVHSRESASPSCVALLCFVLAPQLRSPLCPEVREVRARGPDGETAASPLSSGDHRRGAVSSEMEVLLKRVCPVCRSQL